MMRLVKGRQETHIVGDGCIRRGDWTALTLSHLSPLSLQVYEWGLWRFMLSFRDTFPPKLYIHRERGRDCSLLALLVCRCQKKERRPPPLLSRFFSVFVIFPAVNKLKKNIFTGFFFNRSSSNRFQLSVSVNHLHDNVFRVQTRAGLPWARVGNAPLLYKSEQRMFVEVVGTICNPLNDSVLSIGGLG